MSAIATTRRPPSLDITKSSAQDTAEIREIPDTPSPTSVTLPFFKDRRRAARESPRRASLIDGTIRGYLDTPVSGLSSGSSLPSIAEDRRFNFHRHELSQPFLVVPPDAMDIEESGTPGFFSTFFQRNNAKKIAVSTCASTALITSIALRATLYSSFKETPIGATLSSLAIGASFQVLLESTLPQDFLHNHLVFNMDHAFKLWFTASQIALIFNNNQSVPVEILLNVLTAYFGQCLIQKVSHVFNKEIKRSVYENAMGIGVAQSNRLSLLLEPSKPRHFFLSQLALKGIPAIALGALSQTVDGFSPYVNISAFFLGDILGVFIALQAYNKIGKIAKEADETPVESEQEESDALPPSLTRILKGLSYAHILGSNAAGALFVLNHPIASLLSGTLSGISKPFVKNRFETISSSADLSRSPLLKTVHKVINATFIPLFIGWAGYNFYQYPILSDRVALGTSAIALPSGMLVKGWLNRNFKWGTNSSFVNSLQFYLEEYPIVSILPFMFVEQLTKIGSTSLSTKNTPSAIAGASIGYFSYFFCLGSDMLKTNPNFPEVLDFLQGEFLLWRLGIR